MTSFVKSEFEYILHTIYTKELVITNANQIENILVTESDLDSSLSNYPKSSEEYENILKNIPGVIYRCENDANWTMHYINSGCFDLTGYSIEDLLYNASVSFNSIIYDPDKNYVWDCVQKSLLNKESYNIEYRIITKDNRMKWVYEIGRGTYNSQNELLYIEGFISDNTTQKLKDQLISSLLKIREKSDGSIEELLRITMDEAEILTNSNIGFFHFVNEDQNDIWLQTWSSNTLKNMCTAEGANSHYPLEFAGVWADAIRSKQPVIHNDYESLSHKKGMPKGHAKVIREVVVPVLKDNKVTHILGVGNKVVPYNSDDVEIISQLIELFAEILERKRIQASIAESETLHSTIVNSAPVGIYFIKKGKFIFANPTGAKMLAISQNDIIGKDSLSFIHPDSISTLKPKVSYLSQGKINNLSEIKIIKFDSSEAIFESSTIPVSMNNQPITMIIAMDITYRKKKEAELKELLADFEQSNILLSCLLNEKDDFISEIEKSRQELSILNKQKDKFFSIIAHDLMSPFSGFLGLTKIMSDPTKFDSIDELVKMSKLLHDSASNLYKLISNLLEWSRIQRKTVQVEKIVFNLCDEIDKIVNLSINNYKQKEISFDYQYVDNLWAFGDINLLNTIIRNLLSNAIKFTKRGGAIKLNIEELEDYYEISIQDNGIGISESNLQKIFLINEKISKSGTEGEPSTGLGLILCKEFTEMNGGKITVESKQGIGSKFSFTLPKAAK